MIGRVSCVSNWVFILTMLPGTSGSSALAAMVNQRYLIECILRHGTDKEIAEQDKMNDCYFAKKDWRECKQEVSYIA